MAEALVQQRDKESSFRELPEHLARTGAQVPHVNMVMAAALVHQLLDMVLVVEADLVLALPAFAS